MTQIIPEHKDDIECSRTQRCHRMFQNTKMTQIIQEHKDTAEAFQVRIQQIFNMKSNIKSEKKVNCQNLKLSTIKK